MREQDNRILLRIETTERLNVNFRSDHGLSRNFEHLFMNETTGVLGFCGYVDSDSSKYEYTALRREFTTSNLYVAGPQTGGIHDMLCF